jgi:hypothetical protein
MEPNGIELTKSQQQARKLQRLHDEEQSFLRNGSDHDDDENSDDDDQDGYEYPQQHEGDCAILCTAWSRLSSPTRFLLFLAFSAACVYGVYTLGLEEGVREENHFLGGENRGGGNVMSGDEANRHYLSLQNALTPTLIKSTRGACKELIEVLHSYYGGEEKAKDMLMRSWQAGWDLDVKLFLSEDERFNEDGTFSDTESNVDNDNGDDDDTDDNAPDENLSKREKHKMNKHNNNDERNLGKKKKHVKALNDPDSMNSEEEKRWHQSKRERVTKLITTMARALLNPNQSYFMIGTIGR